MSTNTAKNFNAGPASAFAPLHLVGLITGIEQQALSGILSGFGKYQR
jgi:hypothetical protein